MRFSKGLMFLFFVVFLAGCKDQPVLWPGKTSDLSIAKYIENKPEFSEFEKMLVSNDLNGYLTLRGPYTLLLPTDSAMKEYYTLKGVGSFSDFSLEFQKQLAFNHLLTKEIVSDDIGLGALPDTNAINDYLSSEFDVSDIIINKTSKIIKRNIICSNGVIHIIDRVIDPVTISIFDLIAGNPAYSIFKQGLERTGLKDTLKMITVPVGNTLARTRFTILAVTDTTFSRNGIMNIDQLISRYTLLPENITNKGNGFYKYMEYHCLAGAFFLNMLETGIYTDLLHDKNITVEISDDYKLNPDTLTNKYTGFIIGLSNFAAKNGALHTINNLLPVVNP